MSQKKSTREFEAVFEQYKGWVYRTAYLIVHDPQKAEDIMQEVFVRVYRSNGTFDPQKGSYSNWLRRITINQCINNSRDKGLASLSIEEMEEQGKSIADSRLDPPEQISLKDDIRQMLSSLSASNRAALVLKCVDSLSYDEIAQVLGIPVGTVKSRINRAVSNLRERRKTQEGGLKQ